MTQQPQVQQTARTIKRRRISRKLWIVLVCVAVCIIAVIFVLATLGMLPAIDHVSSLTLASLLAGVIGIVGLLVGIIPLIPNDRPVQQDPDTPIQPSPATTISNSTVHIYQTTPSPSLEHPVPAPVVDAHAQVAEEHRALVMEYRLNKPDVLTNSRVIQQREEVVERVYAQLTQQDCSSVVLTGIGGQGKSTLAALVFNYAEAQRLAAHSYFQDEALWFSVNRDDTFQQLAESILNALHTPIRDFGSLPPDRQANALLYTIEAEQKPRLFVINQFEFFLDEKTGKANRPAVQTFLDALDREARSSRFLLTSRPRPQGTSDLSGACLIEFPVDGLSTSEGIALLRTRVPDIAQQATEQELRRAVERCSGHGLALTLLATRLQKDRSLRVQELLDTPKYASLWGKDIAERLLDDIYTDQLDETQRKLLLGFSIYYEPVPLEAACAILDLSLEDALAAYDPLLTQHLLTATGNKCYQLHAIVTDYAQTHFVPQDKQANADALRTAHEKAAHYYHEQAELTCPKPEERDQLAHVQPFIEAVRHYCDAGQWQAAYDVLAGEKNLYNDLYRWGENTLLLELYQRIENGDWKPDKRERINIYLRLGKSYNFLGDKLQALHYYEQALELTLQVKDKKGEGTTLNNLGLVYNALGDKQKALDYYKQALTLARAVKDPSGEGTTLNNLGGVYNALGDKQKALDYYEQALTLRRAVKDPGGEATTIHNIGCLYFRQEQYKVALACFLVAKPIFIKILSPLSERVQGWIDGVREEVGEERFAQLLAQVEPHAQEIVDEALREK